MQWRGSTAKSVGTARTWSQVRGWNVGVEIVCIGLEDGADMIDVYEQAEAMTHGRSAYLQS